MVFNAPWFFFLQMRRRKGYLAVFSSQAFIYPCCLWMITLTENTPLRSVHVFILVRLYWTAQFMVASFLTIKNISIVQSSNKVRGYKGAKWFFRSLVDSLKLVLRYGGLSLPLFCTAFNRVYVLSRCFPAD